MTEKLSYDSQWLLKVTGIMFTIHQKNTPNLTRADICVQTKWKVKVLQMGTLLFCDLK